MELPLLGNDNDNRVVVGNIFHVFQNSALFFPGTVGKAPAWIQYTFAKTGNKFVWQHENNYTRFDACDKTRSNPPQRKNEFLV